MKATKARRTQSEYRRNQTEGGYTEIAKVTLQTWPDEHGHVRLAMIWLVGVDGTVFQRPVRKGETPDGAAAALLRRGYTDNHSHVFGATKKPARRSRTIHRVEGDAPH